MCMSNGWYKLILPADRQNMCITGPYCNDSARTSVDDYIGKTCAL